MLEGTSVEMSWAFLGAAISRFTRSQTEQRTFYSVGGARAGRPKHLYRSRGSRISRAASSRVVPSKQRTSYFPLTSLTAALDSTSMIFSRMPGYVTVVHRGRDPDRCIRILFESSLSIRSPIVYGILMIRPREPNP